LCRATSPDFSRWAPRADTIVGSSVLAAMRRKNRGTRCPPSAYPLNEFSGSSLFPMGEQTKPILSFGGIDRSWASSRDESLRERLRLIVSARRFLGPAHRRQVIAVCDQQTPSLTPETISRRAAPTFRHLAKLISGFLLWPCLQKIPRARERPGEVPAHLRRGPLTWVWADDCSHTLTNWKQRRTINDRFSGKSAVFFDSAHEIK
ncbi:MAG: hypothetical protein RL077_5099, partial [Verrucomicrobiota bacterium]